MFMGRLSTLATKSDSEVESEAGECHRGRCQRNPDRRCQPRSSMENNTVRPATFAIVQDVECAVPNVISARAGREPYRCLRCYRRHEICPVKHQ